jgi:hypothetical protein
MALLLVLLTSGGGPGKRTLVQTLRQQSRLGLVPPSLCLCVLHRRVRWWRVQGQGCSLSHVVAGGHGLHGGVHRARHQLLQPARTPFPLGRQPHPRQRAL